MQNTSSVLEWRRGLDLVVLPSPYRELTWPLLRYIDCAEQTADQDVVTVDPMYSDWEPGLPTNVDVGAQLRVRLRLTKYFARDRRRVAFAKQNVSDQILDRIAFAPPEVDVRDLPGRVAKM